MIWGMLVHLGYNFWYEKPFPGMPPVERFKQGAEVFFQPRLRFEDATWEALRDRMVAEGLNLVVLDLGDGVRYRSHPEIAVENAWSPARLAREVAKLREAGLEPVPKLNFSAAHDIWLGPWSRMVSTDSYYRVCRDLIAETVEIFDRPRYFHLGMDEETAAHQSRCQYAVCRQHELWWHDLAFFVREVEKGGARPWVWADGYARNPAEYSAKMPRSVLQGYWYYGTVFDRRKNRHVRGYLELDRAGFDQVPTTSNYRDARNAGKTASWCRRHLTAGRLGGFLQTTWLPTIGRFEGELLAAVEQVGRAGARRDRARAVGPPPASRPGS